MFRRFRSNKFAPLLAISCVIGVIAWASPGMALQYRITPSNPRLGDTLSISLRLDPSTPPSSPDIQVGQKTYPAFPVGENQFRAFVPTSPLDRPGKLQLQITGGGETRSLAVTLKNRKFPTQSIWLPPGKGNDGTDYEFDRVDAFKKLVTPEKLWQGALLRPNQGEVTAGYGIRRYYNGVFAKDYYHRGIDYGGATGSPVVAPAAGRVALVGREAKGFKIHGNTVGIDHGQGVETIFLHLSRIDVKEGDMVRAGQVVGAVGATGAVTGPHLHWGFYVHGVSVDPQPWRSSAIE